MAGDVQPKHDGPLWKPKKPKVGWKKAPLPPGMTRHQLKGETEEQHQARVAQEIRLGYRQHTSKSWRWTKARDKFLKQQKLDVPGDWWRCDTSHGFGCDRLIDTPEVDHIIKRSVRPDLILEPSNFQVLCHDCHMKKDNGFKFN